MATTKRRLGGMVLPDDMFPTQFRGPMPALPNPTQTGQPAFTNVRGDKPMVSPQPVGPQAAGMRRPEQSPNNPLSFGTRIRLADEKMRMWPRNTVMPMTAELTPEAKAAQRELGNRVIGVPAYNPPSTATVGDLIAQKGYLGGGKVIGQSIGRGAAELASDTAQAVGSGLRRIAYGTEGQAPEPAPRTIGPQPNPTAPIPAEPMAPPPAASAPRDLPYPPAYIQWGPARAQPIPGLPDRRRGYVNDPTAPITAEQAWALRDGAPTEITVPAFATDRRTGARLMPPTERSAPRVAKASNLKEVAAAERAARDAMEARTNATAEAYRERFVASGNRGLRRGEPIGRPAWRQRQTEDLLRLQGRQDIAKQQEANKPSMQPTSVQNIGDTVVAYGADGKPVFQPADRIYNSGLTRPVTTDKTDAAKIDAASAALENAQIRLAEVRRRQRNLVFDKPSAEEVENAEADVAKAQELQRQAMGMGTASDPNTTPPTETPPPGAVQKRQLSDGTWQYTDKDGNIIPRR